MVVFYTFARPFLKILLENYKILCHLWYRLCYMPWSLFLRVKLSKLWEFNLLAMARRARDYAIPALKLFWEHVDRMNRSYDQIEEESVAILWKCEIALKWPKEIFQGLIMQLKDDISICLRCFVVIIPLGNSLTTSN